MKGKIKMRYYLISFCWFVLFAALAACGLYFSGKYITDISWLRVAQVASVGLPLLAFIVVEIYRKIRYNAACTALSMLMFAGMR